MLSLGMDIGTSTVKLVLLKNQEIEKQWMAVHHGNPFVCLKKGLSTLELAMDTPFSLCVTGSNTEALLEQDSAIPSLGDIPAIVEGVRWIIPQVGSVIEIGSQGARFITEVQSRTPQFAANEHCAGGTGSFFRGSDVPCGLQAGGLSALVEQAQSVPRLFRTLRSVCQNGYHSPPAGRRFHTGHSAGIVLCNDPQLQGDHCTAAAGLQTGGILRRRDLQLRCDTGYPGCVRPDRRGTDRPGRSAF